MDKVNFNNYLSPFSWRYGSGQMLQIFSEVNRRKTWRKIWVSLAKAQYKAGLLTKLEYKDIEKNAEKIDIINSLEAEKVIYHDVMAEIKVFAKSAKIGGGKIHLGATSTDITDNSDIFLYKEALELVEKKLKNLIKAFLKKIAKYQNTVCMAYTHLQPAEPTTLGYRFSLYAQDLLSGLNFLRFVIKNLKTKGIKGAVGTSASYERLMEKSAKDSFWLEDEIMKDLNLQKNLVTSQTYPRKTDLMIVFALTSIAQSIHKFCFDLRIMQSPNFGEWSEPRNKERVGSSAMPFKKNPDKAEKICSLARYIMSSIWTSSSNASNSLLERTLDDSANRRIYMPESFLATDEIITESAKIVEGLTVFTVRIKKNLDTYGPFAATEIILMEAVKCGANRQELHEKIRNLSTKSWLEITNDKPNPLVNLLKNDKMITKFIPPARIEKLISPESHIGTAAKRCALFLKEAKKEISL